MSGTNEKDLSISNLESKLICVNNCCRNTEVGAFTMVGEYLGVVRRVIDGDTVVVALLDELSSPPKANLWHLRLHGIDTCELHPKRDIEDHDKHVADAVRSKELLEKLVLDHVIFARIVKPDKFQGRWVASIFVREKCECVDECQSWIDVSAHMLSNAPGCVAYDGGNKVKARNIVMK